MALNSHLIQKALYDALIAANVAGGKVYDGDQMQDAGDMPYVEIGEWTFAPNDTGCDIGLEATATLHIWAKEPGHKQVQQISDAMRAAIHRQPLTIAGVDCLDVQCESVTSFTDPDGQTRHGVARITIIVSEE